MPKGARSIETIATGSRSNDWLGVKESSELIGSIELTPGSVLGWGDIGEPPMATQISQKIVSHKEPKVVADHDYNPWDNVPQAFVDGEQVLTVNYFGEMDFGYGASWPTWADQFGASGGGQSSKLAPTTSGGWSGFAEEEEIEIDQLNSSDSSADASRTSSGQGPLSSPSMSSEDQEGGGGRKCKRDEKCYMEFDSAVESEGPLEDPPVVDQKVDEVERPEVARVRMSPESHQGLDDRDLEIHILTVSRWNPPRGAKSEKVTGKASEAVTTAALETKVSQSLNT